MTRPDPHAVPPAFLRSRRAGLYAPPSGLALPERSLGTLDYVHHCDALTLLRALPSNYINCLVTSPPYFGLRDYQVAGQIGLEATPQEFVRRLVDVFREVKRVLRDDGVIWVNMGDSYSSGGRTTTTNDSLRTDTVNTTRVPVIDGMGSKQLLGMPWRLAFALQDDGWILRSEIIWHKPNPMPESVTDRCTKSHEQVFMLAKSERYFFDADSIREPAARPGDVQTFGGDKGRNYDPAPDDPNFRNGHHQWGRTIEMGSHRNKRTVWTIATEPSDWEYCAACNRLYAGADRNMIERHKVRIDGEWREVRICLCGEYEAWVGHFAMYPQDLIEPCILAGCPHKVCAVCGSPWVRQTEVDYEHINYTKPREMSSYVAKDRGAVANKIVTTLGFAPTCDHSAATRPGIVLDPFMGSGTTGLVARRLGRHYIGSELNREYVELARQRLDEPYTLPMMDMIA